MRIACPQCAEQQAILSALGQLGNRKMGMAPPSQMESEISEWFEALSERLALACNATTVHIEIDRATMCVIVLLVVALCGEAMSISVPSQQGSKSCLNDLCTRPH